MAKHAIPSQFLFADGEVVARVLGGDKEAFAWIIRRYETGLLRFATRLLGSVDDAEDAVSESLVRAYRHLSSCRDRSSLRSWLYGIVANRCRTFLTRTHTRRMLLAGAESLLTPVSGTTAFELLEQVGQIEKGLETLPPEQRQAVVLKHVEGLSYEEMTVVTGTGVSALKMRVQRGREALLRILG